MGGHAWSWQHDWHHSEERQHDDDSALKVTEQHRPTTAKMMITAGPRATKRHQPQLGMLPNHLSHLKRQGQSSQQQDRRHGPQHTTALR